MKTIKLEAEKQFDAWGQIQVRRYYEAVRWLPSLLRETQPETGKTIAERRRLVHELQLCLKKGAELEVQGRLVDEVTSARFQVRAEALVRWTLEHLERCDLTRCDKER